VISNTKAVWAQKSGKIHVDVGGLNRVVANSGSVDTGCGGAVAQHGVEVVAEETGCLLLKCGGDGFREIADVGQVDVVCAVIHANTVTKTLWALRVKDSLDHVHPFAAVVGVELEDLQTSHARGVEKRCENLSAIGARVVVHSNGKALEAAARA
jgi:hypothetical protein